MENIILRMSEGLILYFIIDSLVFLYLGCTSFIKKTRKEYLEKLKNKIEEKSYIPVSILIPITKNSRLKEETFSSLIKQNYPSFEIIIICEKELKELEMFIGNVKFTKVEMPYEQKLETKEIKEIYEGNKNGVRILLIKKENGGKSDAINVGLNMSKYPYVFLASPSNTYQKKTLATLMQKPLEEEETIFCKASSVLEANTVLEKLKMHHQNRIEAIPKNTLKKTRRCLFVNPDNSVIKKRDLIESGGFDTKMKEDYGLLPKMEKYCKRKKVPFHSYYLFDVLTSISKINNWKNLICEIGRDYLCLVYLLWKTKFQFLFFQGGFTNFWIYLYYVIFEALKPVILLLSFIILPIACYKELLSGVFIVLFLGFYCLLEYMVSSLFGFQKRSF